MSHEDTDTDSGSEVGSISLRNGNSSKKRKREGKAYDEIEVDVAAPEPPSKKALRKAKKAKPEKAVPDGDGEQIAVADNAAEETPGKRSEYGVWIGNLPWSAGKPELTKFILDNAEISESDITRIHLPAPAKGKMDPSRQKLQPQNKGFAYVDFKSELACKAVIALSEKLLTGRRLLIKNAKSYEGRPDASETAEKKGNPPSKRIFIGNLTFDTTEDDLKEQFSRCGETLSVFMATFEDSGNCKGYAWITFRETESAEKAVRGWVNWEQEDSEEDEQETAEKRKAKKPRKWWVNKLKGRSLRIEFAEEPSVRYQKRYGKPKGEADGEAGQVEAIVEVDSTEAPRERSRPLKRDREAARSSDGTPFKARRKVDARTIAPGAALSKAPRQSAAIVQSAGKKVTFD